MVGGVQMHEQRHGLRSGVEIVVATPGRFIDHLQQVCVGHVHAHPKQRGAAGLLQRLEHSVMPVYVASAGQHQPGSRLFHRTG